MKLLLVLTLSLFSSLVFAQTQGSGRFVDAIDLNLWPFQSEVLDATPDFRALKMQKEEDRVQDSLGGYAYRFGYVVNANQSFSSWNTEPIFDGVNYHYVYPVTSTGAQTINVGLEDIHITEGARLYLQNKSGNMFYGPYVQNDVVSGEIGTELLPTDQAYLHYITPVASGLSGKLSVLNHGYRSIAELNNYAKSTCQIDVNCPDGLPYDRIKDAVVILINSSNATFCSGTLVANTNYDGRPFILTANHCYFNNPTGWVFRFNYQASTCGGDVSETTVSLNGGVFRARYNPADFLLVEITGGLIDGQLPAATNAYYSGWDFSGRDIHRAVGIHHPNGVMKKISFDDHLIRKASVRNGSFTSIHNGVWRVVWDRGTSTENKSSGSGLFDSYQRLVGQLWGGSSSCTNTTGADYYGRFNLSWNFRPDSIEQLQYWLDPNGLSNALIDGHGIGGSPLNKDLAISMQPVYNSICNASDSIEIYLSNVGNTAISSITLNYTFDNWVTTETLTYSEGLNRLQSQPIYIYTDGLSAGTYAFAMRVVDVDGSLDGNAVNDTLSYTFDIMNADNTFHVELKLDCYASENYFLIRSDEGKVVYNGPFYADFTDKGLHEYDICLQDGCYTFEIFDAYGDGFSYGNNNDCEIGSLVLKKDELVLGEIDVENSDFGSSAIIPFCVGPLQVNLANDITFDVYPNPTKEWVTISSNEVMDEVKLFGLDGRLLLQTTLEKKNLHHLSINLSSGCYILTAFRDGVSAFSTKLIVE